MQSGDPNVVDAAGDDRPDETTDSGIVAFQPCGSDLAPESVLTDTMMDPGTTGANTSTPVQGQSHWFGPRNGVRPRWCGLDMPIRGPDKPPPPWQPADMTVSLMDTVMQLQSEVYSLKFAPIIPLTSATRTPPARPRPGAFTTTEFTKFSRSTSWTSTDRSLML